MTKDIRVLHLSTWYPSVDAPNEVPFIKAHYEALDPYVSQSLVHVEVKEGARFGFTWKIEAGDQSEVRLLGVRGPARIREWLTLALLIALRLRLGRRSWDVLVIHIAWPTFRFPTWVKWLYGSRVVVIEHWSAYSQNFYLDPEGRAHARMRKMFSSDTPILAVSKKLADDIAAFAKRTDLDVRVLPNVVDQRFRFDCYQHSPTLFMAANWNSFRLPLLVLQAIPNLLDVCPALKVRIAGGGPQLQVMQDYVSAQVWRDRVTFLGPVGRDQIAVEMRQVTVFAHPAQYETFSVITAEAMCCGVPVVVSNVGALPELVRPDENGLLVENDDASWREALIRAFDPFTVWDREGIARSARARFSPDVVGQELADILSEMASR